MIQDLIVTARTLIKQPGYALAVVMTLALGIGASTMMFGLADAALLRPLPFADPDRLVMLTGVAGPQRAPRGASFPEVADWRTMSTTLEGLAIYDEISLNLQTGTEAVRVEAEMVSASYFPILGKQAAIGRTFLPEEDAVPDRNPVAIVSGRFWRERLHGDPRVLERTLQLNDRPFQIVGVMPDGFAGVSFDSDVWVPSMMVSLMSAPSVVQARGSRWLLAVGRLAGGVGVERAQEDLTRVAGLLERQYPDTNRERGVDVHLLRQDLLGESGFQVKALFSAVLLFLAVACANVAALQLVRASARRRELAVRLALGARPWHVLRQRLMESLLLSLTAGAAGVLVAAWSTTAVVALVPDGALPRHVQPAIDPRALTFTLAVSIVVGLLVAFISGFSAARENLAEVIKQGGRALDSTIGALRRPSTQQLLVAGEIAAATILLALAGLLVRSLDRTLHVDLGLEPGGVTVAQVTLPTSRYPPELRTIFVQRLEASLRALPGVTAAAIGSDVPLSGSSSASTLLPDVSTDSNRALRYYRHIVTPQYFETLRIAVVNGRTFTPQDRRGGPPVAIINDRAAQRIWGNDNPVGRHIRTGGASATPVEIVGVASTARFRDLTTDLSAPGSEPDVYFPYGQVTDSDLRLAVKTADGAQLSLVALQDAVRQLDAGLPVYQVRRLTEVVGRQTSSARFVSALLTGFSAGALLLAAVGLYGLLAYVVGLSRREIAIRLALGADRPQVAALIVRNGLLVVIVGLAVGIAGAVAAGRAIRTQLFDTGYADPATFAVVACVLLVVTLAASVIPARRAMHVEPHAALKME